VPLLYVSLSPPAWLRASGARPEEEGLQAFMADLQLSEDTDALSSRALEWAMRLVGGASAATFDSSRQVRASLACPLHTSKSWLAGFQHPAGGQPCHAGGSAHTVLVLQVSGLSSSGSLAILSGLSRQAWAETR